MDILLYQEQSSSIFRCFLQMAATKKLSLQLEIPLDHLTNFESTMKGTVNPLIWILIIRISNPMNPFSKRIPQIKNPDKIQNPFLDSPKETHPQKKPWERGWRSPVPYTFQAKLKSPPSWEKLFSNQTARYNLSIPYLGLKSNRLRFIAPILFFQKLGYRPNKKSTFCYQAVRNAISRQKRGIQLNTV